VALEETEDGGSRVDEALRQLRVGSLADHDEQGDAVAHDGGQLVGL